MRNAKALALLRSKDETINSLETRYAESSAEAAQLRAQLQATTRQMEESQNRVQDLIADNAAQKERASQAVNRYEQVQAEIEHLKAVETRARETDAAFDRVGKELASSKNEIATMTTALQAADEMIEEMQEAALHREKENRRKGREVDQLRSYVVRLLGLASEEAQRALEAPLRAQTDAASTIDALQEANEALEIALVAANLRLAGVDPSRHSSADSLLAELASRHHHPSDASRPLETMHPEDSDEIVKLCGEVAELGGKLEAAEEGKAHFEAACAVAQRAALHAEAELQSLLSQHTELQACERSLLEKLDAESQRAAAAEALCVEFEQEIENATEKAGQQAQTVKTLSEKCEDLEDRAMVAEGKVENAEKAAEIAKQQGIVEKQNAAERVAAALRQSGQLKTQMLDAQKENDTLKSKIASLESKVSFAAAKAAAQQAAEALTAHRNRALAATTPVEVLAHAVAEAAQQQIQLQMDLKTCTELNSIHERTIEGLRGNISRLRAVLLEDEEEEEEKKFEENTACSLPELPSTSLATLTSLREQLICGLAAQKGQAQAFATLIEESTERETLLKTQLHEAQFIEEERQRLEGMCAASVATMHGALAQIALAEGSEDTGEALLEVDVNPEDLSYVTSAVSAKLQEFAKRIVRERQETDDGRVDPGAILVASQREVIAALSAQLATNSGGDDGIGGIKASLPTEGVPAATSSSSVSSGSSLKGLCGLLLHQLKTLGKTLSGAGDSRVDAVLQSMRSTIMVVQSEIEAALGSLQVSTLSTTVLPLPKSPAPPAVPEGSSSTSKAAALANQVDDLTERLTIMSERISLLTAANEAAQAEASHGKSAVAELAHALQQAHMENEETSTSLQQAAIREKELQNQLEETTNECRLLLDALHALEIEKKTWQGQVNAKIVALQSQFEASVQELAAYKQSNITANSAETVAACMQKIGNPTTASSSTSLSASQFPSGLGTLLDGMDALLSDAFTMGERIKELEAAAEKQAEHRARSAEQVASARAEARNEIKALEMKSAKHAQRADALAQKVSELEKEQEELLNRLDGVRDVHKQQLEHSAQLHAAQLAVMSAETEAHRQEMLRHSVAEAAAAEQRAYEDVKDRVESARRALEEAQRTCGQLRDERDAVHAEFIKYRQIKTAEVQLLEQRLGIFSKLNQANGDSYDGTNTGEGVNAFTEGQAGLGPASFSEEVHIATAAGQIAGACRADAVAAALREAKLERSHRLQLQESLAMAQAAEKKAAIATKAAEKEVASLRQRLVETTVGSEQQVKELKNKLEMSKLEALTAEEKVKNHHAEVEQLSQRVADLEHAEMVQEQERQEAAHRDLAAVHAALSARDASIHDITGRLIRAERNLEGLSHDLDQSE
jgi:chromosome segregation ATPase